MSRHEMIRMFELVMRALLVIMWNGKEGEVRPVERKITRDFENFMGELHFKDGDGG